MSSISRIADRLRLLRVRHDLTQEEAAKLLGMTLRFVQVLESGKKRQIWLETVERIVAPFGLEVWQFLGPELPTNTQLKPAAKQHVASRGRRGPRRKRASPTQPPSGPG